MNTHPLYDAALARDSAAFAVAYDRCAPTLYGLLLRILHDADDAQEILQETFLAAWSGAGKFDRSRGSEMAWLITMARSRGIDRLRARDRRGVREEQAGREISRAASNVDDSAEERLAWSEIRIAVRDALQQLPDAQRSTLELAYFDGLSQSEIAARLGQPLGTIKTRTTTAMKRLREQLDGLRRR